MSTNWLVDFLTEPDGKQIGWNCILLPTSDGRALFIGEQISTDPFISQVIDKLNRQVRLFRTDNEHAKKLALNKHAELEAVIAQAHEVSNLDALTFLPNRRQIIRELQDEVLRAQRYNSLLSISILDVDHFKLVNDTYGHVVGDHVLREIAIQLRDHVRHPDMVARYGGEEFLILLPNSTKEAASEQAARLCKQIRDAIIHVDSFDIHVTLSIGVAQFQQDVDSWQTLLSRADTALYEAKNAGRDQWSISET
jgi:diguanylate cyclase (GGDEF)-like protein